MEGEGMGAITYIDIESDTETLDLAMVVLTAAVARAIKVDLCAQDPRTKLLLVGLLAGSLARRCTDGGMPEDIRERAMVAGAESQDRLHILFGQKKS